MRPRLADWCVRVGLWLILKGDGIELSSGEECPDCGLISDVPLDEPCPNCAIREGDRERDASIWQDGYNAGLCVGAAESEFPW
jgi:hypothetical protein